FSSCHFKEDVTKIYDLTLWENSIPKEDLTFKAYMSYKYTCENLISKKKRNMTKNNCLLTLNDESFSSRKAM
mgnify:CR=1